jgi:hypothetical protein
MHRPAIEAKFDWDGIDCIFQAIRTCAAHETDSLEMTASPMG